MAAASRATHATPGVPGERGTASAFPADGIGPRIAPPRRLVTLGLLPTEHPDNLSARRGTRRAPRRSCLTKQVSCKWSLFLSSCPGHATLGVIALGCGHRHRGGRWRARWRAPDACGPTPVQRRGARPAGRRGRQPLAWRSLDRLAVGPALTRGRHIAEPGSAIHRGPRGTCPSPTRPGDIGTRAPAEAGILRHPRGDVRVDGHAVGEHHEVRVRICGAATCGHNRARLIRGVRLRRPRLGPVLRPRGWGARPGLVSLRLRHRECGRADQPECEAPVRRQRP